MTLSTDEPLCASVLRVAECKPEGAGIRGSSKKTFRLVTNTTRSNLSTGRGFTAGCVTRVALIMSRNAGWDAERSGAAAQASMTGRTAALRARGATHVLGMIKSNVEAFFELRWKTFKRRV